MTQRSQAVTAQPARGRVRSVSEPESLQALGHPLRVRILEALREPDSAAGVARRIGQSRQNVNHHLKGLERAGLVEHVGERRSGNFIEELYRAAASTFLVSPRAAWGGRRRAEALGEQLSLRQLFELGERLQRDTAALLDRAAFDGETIASASVEAEVGFESAAARAAFMNEYLAALGPLLKKYGHHEGARYRVAVGVYPDPETGPGGER